MRWNPEIATTATGTDARLQWAGGSMTIVISPYMSPYEVPRDNLAEGRGWL